MVGISEIFKATIISAMVILGHSRINFAFPANYVNFIGQALASHKDMKNFSYFFTFPYSGKYHVENQTIIQENFRKSWHKMNYRARMRNPNPSSEKRVQIWLLGQSK